MSLAALLFSGLWPLTAEEVVRPPSRDVTPPGFTPAPKMVAPLFRELQPPPPPETPRWHRLLLPVTTDSGTFMVKNRAIRVSGIAAPSVDQTCRLNDTDWPCGRTALHQLRMFLGGRAVECYFPFAQSADQVVARCRVGSTDLGHWLLAQGWAKPDANAPDEYRAAAFQARCARLGLWRGQPRDESCDGEGPD
jgi:hypothetical protein